MLRALMKKISMQEHVSNVTIEIKILRKNQL